MYKEPIDSVEYTGNIHTHCNHCERELVVDDFHAQDVMLCARCERRPLNFDVTTPASGRVTYAKTSRFQR